MSHKISVAVAGSSGRMGKEICQLLKNDQKVSKVFPLGRRQGYVSLEELAGQDVDVLIDFSLPEFFPKALAWCEEHGVPFVSGTTGISAQDQESLNQAAKKIAVLWASNMSLGINVLNQILKNLKALSSYEFSLLDVHHVNKKDTPSGTAILLRDTLNATLGEEKTRVESRRQGDVFGVHEIQIRGPEEIITLRHEALNRTVFARGAVRAAHWLADKAPGHYSMSDAL